MKQKKDRRSFLKELTITGIGVPLLPGALLSTGKAAAPAKEAVAGKTGSAAEKRAYNEAYKGEYLRRVAFPIGGTGAGMFCLEGTGAISHMSVRIKPALFHEPCMFAALAIKGRQNGVKILEGQVPDWKMFGQPSSGGGAGGTTYGLPRFTETVFTARFPYGYIDLEDSDMPVKVQIKGWSPFIPTDADNSGLPAGALEYRIKNTSSETLDAVFSYSSKNFMVQNGGGKGSIKKMPRGFVLSQEGTTEKPHMRGDFAIYTNEGNTSIDYCWFRGAWWDPLTMAWNTIQEGKVKSNEPVADGAPGASLFVPFTLPPGGEKTVRVMMAWYVPDSDWHLGEDTTDAGKDCTALGLENYPPSPSRFYKPWYSSKFKDIGEVADYWSGHYEELDKKSSLFRDAFYASTLPPEVVEAVAANLTILKSTTVLRQYDGRLWNFEGCHADNGCCDGSCTHVWNYAQAIPHLFPTLEKSLRHTEFCENQNTEGHQGFRAALPIRPIKHGFHAAADGQLGGIMKVYREWRISGDSNWLKNIFPLVKTSMDYCIRTWDPRHKGIVEEPHHNTYDIEFWGPNGMITSFYLGALNAMIKMCRFLKKDAAQYEELVAKGKKYMETELYDGEYFIQQIKYTGLNAPDPVHAQSLLTQYSAEALEVLKKEGPKYQYGKGCLSDGVLGCWMSLMCGLEDPVATQQTKSHLLAVHKYNLKKDLRDHANPQRPSYAMGNEGGLLLCSWPKGGKLSLPFVYSDEVWTGIEHQVASHLMLTGQVEQGLEVVRAARDRYDGRIRNPFNEYECGNWYGRALASYGYLQGLTGIRYDAVDKTLYVDSKVGDFVCFLSTATGFGTVSLKGGKATVKAVYGEIPVKKTVIGAKA